MNASCPHCQTAVRVDPAHFPAGGKARVGCPSCKKPFEVAGPAAGEAAAGGASEAWLREQLGTLKAEMKQEILVELLKAGAAAPAGRPAGAGSARPPTRSALICEDDPAVAQSLQQTLTGLGWKPELAPDTAAALKMLDRNDYGLVAVDRGLAGDPQGGMKVLEWINGQPGPERRRLFVAFVTDELKSMDTGSAFIAGANLTLNRKDLARLPALLKQGLEERDELYRVFDDVTDAVSRGE